MNLTLNYSPNFQTPKRNAKQIKFIIFHYTGMKKDSEAIARLTNIKSKVSCHYLIKKDGEIIMMVPDLYSAWHSGKSHWKKNDSLNKNSIGIEICNPGHEFNYKKFSNRQILSLIKLSKFLTKKYKIKSYNKLKVDNTNKLLMQINPILSKFSNENEISIILKKKDLIIGKTELDITEEIIKITARTASNAKVVVA